MRRVTPPGGLVEDSNVRHRRELVLLPSGVDALPRGCSRGCMRSAVIPSGVVALEEVLVDHMLRCGSS
jgi:hypothetical protein